MIDRSLDTVADFCFKDVHVDRNENEDYVRVCSSPQFTVTAVIKINE